MLLDETNATCELKWLQNKEQKTENNYGNVMMKYLSENFQENLHCNI